MSNNSFKENLAKIEQEILTDKKPFRHLQLEELNIYKLADEISDDIWRVVSQWDSFSKNTLGEQIVRSADSMGANIAEGYGRYFFKDNILFLYYSRGSAYETNFWLNKVNKRNLIEKTKFEKLNQKIERFLLEINKVIKTMKNQANKFSLVPWYKYKPKSK